VYLVGMYIYSGAISSTLPDKF
jgi:hypothetical protein